MPSLQEIQTISSLLNDLSLSDKFGLISNNRTYTPLFPQTFGPLFKDFSIRSVSFVSKVCFFINLLKGLNNFFKNKNISFIEYEVNRNKRSMARDALISNINEISIWNMDTVRTQAGMLSMLTSQTDEISRNAEVNIIMIK